MKKTLLSLGLAFLLSACGTGTETTEPDQNENQNTETEVPETNETNEENNQASSQEDNETETAEDQPAAVQSEDEDSNADEASPEAEVTDALSEYSTEQIEYARVWLNFGPNPDADQVYYEVLPAGSLINPDVEASAAYPEDVVRLEGGRRVDGAVTYSSNGDGTINLYNVPYTWDMNDAVEEEVYISESEKVLESIQTEYVEPLEDEAVIQTIDKLTPITE